MVQRFGVLGLSKPWVYGLPTAAGEIPGINSKFVKGFQKHDPSSGTEPTMADMI